MGDILAAATGILTTEPCKEPGAQGSRGESPVVITVWVDWPSCRAATASGMTPNFIITSWH